jgi:hypothetical protein
MTAAASACMVGMTWLWVSNVMAIVAWAEHLADDLGVHAP